MPYRATFIILVTPIDKNNCPTRSRAISDLISEKIVQKEWVEGKEVAGTITLVFNHHKRELVIIVKGKPREIERLAQILKTTKGVKHASLNMTTTGKEI